MEVDNLPYEERTAISHREPMIRKVSEDNNVAELQRMIALWHPDAKLLYLPLHCAISRGSADTARYLLRFGVPYSGNLVIAALKAGSIPIINILQEYGWQCDANIGGNNAYTALNVAVVHRCSPSIIKYLLELGADPDLGPDGTAVAATAADASLSKTKAYNLYNAARTGYVESTKLLLEYSTMDISRACLLHGAVQSGNIELLRYILTLRGVDIHEFEYPDLTGRRNSYGTPLHRAVMSSSSAEVVETLLVHGASVNYPCTFKYPGKTVLDLVLDYEHGKQIPQAIINLVVEAALKERMSRTPT